MDISLIIPCYNEEENVDAFFSESEEVFYGKGFSYEYIFVNDGSSDSTQDKLVGIYNNHPDRNITVIRFSRNFGKESAIYAGMKNAIGDAICIIDADLQQRPETALKMYQKLKNSPTCDCVTAFQRIRHEGRIVGALKSAFYKIINESSEIEFKNGASDFRVFRSKVKDAMLQLGEYHRFSKGIFSWVGFSVEYIEYEADERNAGTTKWSIKSLFKYAFNGILAFSTAPLRFSTILGSVATLGSLIYLFATLIRKITHHISVSGFTQIVFLVAFLGGLILFSLGIIGEYIAKIYQQVKNRPIYIADEILTTRKN